MNRIRLLPLLISLIPFFVIGMIYYSPYDGCYYIVLLVTSVISFCNYLFLKKLLSKHVVIYFFSMAFLFLVTAYLLDWYFNQDGIFIFLLTLHIVGCLVNSIVFHFYGMKQLEIMEAKGYSCADIKEVAVNIVYKELIKGLRGKFLPMVNKEQIARYIASGVVAGNLVMKGTDSVVSCEGVTQLSALNGLSLGNSGSHIDSMVETAMSIAANHLADFEHGDYSVINSHINGFNPATGLAMTSDYFDAGGDVYGSSLNHDSQFSFGNGVTGDFEHSLIDHGSSFNGSFDDYHHC